MTEEDNLASPGLGKQDMLLASLRTFYADHPRHLRTLTDILGPQPRVSLRVIDWLVTNHAKWKNIVYPHPVTGTAFNMFLWYKNALRSYSKKLLDPFCRRNRIDFENADGELFRTTVGQLNFFRWALRHGVVDYALEHAEEIEDDMLSAIKHRAAMRSLSLTSTDEEASDTIRFSADEQAIRRSRFATRAKRKELSHAAIKSCTKTRVRAVIKFR